MEEEKVRKRVLLGQESNLYHPIPSRIPVSMTLRMLITERTLKGQSTPADLDNLPHIIDFKIKCSHKEVSGLNTHRKDVYKQQGFFSQRQSATSNQGQWKLGIKHEITLFVEYLVLGESMVIGSLCPHKSLSQESSVCKDTCINP